MNPVFAEFAFWDWNTAEREKANSRSAILFSDCSAPAGTAPDTDTSVNYAVVFCYRKAQYTGMYLSVLLLLYRTSFDKSTLVSVSQRSFLPENCHTDILVHSWKGRSDNAAAYCGRPCCRTGCHGRCERSIQYTKVTSFQKILFQTTLSFYLCTSKQRKRQI